MISVYNLFEGEVSRSLHSPEWAYFSVHNKEPKKNLIPQFLNKDDKVSWNGKLVDKNLNINWIKRLNNISGINVNSICEGHSKTRLTHLTVVFDDLDKRNIDKIRSYIYTNVPNSFIKIFFDTSKKPLKYHFNISTDNWYGKTKDNKEWSDWWTKLVDTIEKLEY